MKFVKFLILLVVLALPLVFVNAQEEEAVTEEPWGGAYILTAESGGFIQDGEEVFTLTLNDVSDYTNWLVNMPDLSSGILTTQDLISFWSFEPELMANALVTTENESILVTISLADAMAYDLEAETLTFIARVVSISVFDPEVDDSKAEAPEEFESVTLFINMDDTFANGIAAGALARSEGTRTGSLTATCTNTRTCDCSKGTACPNK